MPWKVSSVLRERARFVTEWESQDWSLAGVVSGLRNYPKHGI
jgi:hypothetical protein